MENIMKPLLYKMIGHCLLAKRLCFDFSIMGQNGLIKTCLREREYITTCGHDVYNKNPNKHSQNITKEWTVNGVTYRSGAQAARQLGKSTSSIYRLIKRKGSFQTFFGTKSLCIEGKLFPSLAEAQSSLKISK